MSTNPGSESKRTALAAAGFLLVPIVCCGLPVLIAVMMGVITATFGGVIVDVLCNEVPRIFRRTELHATCAFAGGWCCVALDGLESPRSVAIGVGAAVAFGLRMLAVGRGWRLPAVGPDRSGSG